MRCMLFNLIIINYHLQTITFPLGDRTMRYNTLLVFIHDLISHHKTLHFGNMQVYPLLQNHDLSARSLLEPHRLGVVEVTDVKMGRLWMIDEQVVGKQ